MCMPQFYTKIILNKITKKKKYKKKNCFIFQTFKGILYNFLSCRICKSLSFSQRTRKSLFSD